jgi:hypothetical protein
LLLRLPRRPRPTRHAYAYFQRLRQALVALDSPEARSADWLQPDERLKPPESQAFQRALDAKPECLSSRLKSR